MERYWLAVNVVLFVAHVTRPLQAREITFPTHLHDRHPTLFQEASKGKEYNAGDCFHQ